VDRPGYWHQVWLLFEVLQLICEQHATEQKKYGSVWKENYMTSHFIKIIRSICTSDRVAPPIINTIILFPILLKLNSLEACLRTESLQKCKKKTYILKFYFTRSESKSNIWKWIQRFSFSGNVNLTKIIPKGLYTAV
jgi:hypothetical protein